MSSELGGVEVLEAADAVIALLSPTTAGSWSQGVPELDFTVATVIAHAAEVCLWYAIDLSSAGIDLVTVEHHVHADRGDAALLLENLRTYAQICAASVDASPADRRGYHPMGRADRSGFAAMACDELLVHGDDAARGLGLDFLPPAALCERVVRRLFPWIEPGDDPWTMLRYANGRIALEPDRPRLQGWAWHCAPVSEWAG